MSMLSWTCEGYGVRESVLAEVSVELKVEFIRKHFIDIYNALMSDMAQSIVDSLDKEEVLDYCQEWIDEYEDDYCNRGFSIFFAKALQEEKHLEVSVLQGEYPEERAVLYETRLPWEMADCMRDIFAEYLNELGIDAESTCGRYSVEFYG